MSTGPNQILLKRSDSPGVEPSGLSFGEPAVNTSDGVLFVDKQTSGTVDSNHFWKFHGTTNEGFVTSVNGRTGPVLFNSGTNITLTTGVGGITIDAFGAGSNVTSFNGVTGTVEGVGSFNGATGTVEGVGSFNGITGAVQGVALFNGATGNVSGLASFNGTTSAVDTKTLHLHVAGLSTDGGITLSGVLDLRTGSSFSGTLNSANGISAGGSTIGGVNIGSGAIVASGAITAAFFSGTATAALSAGSATTATSATNVAVTATNDSTNYRVPFAAGSASGTVALAMKSDGGTTHEGLFFQPDIATLSTGVVNPTGISLGSAGITFTDGTTMSTAFTSVLKGKLDAIEASADVTDATNVTSAGALMDSELTSITDVKALNQSVVSGANPVFTNITALVGISVGAGGLTFSDGTTMSTAIRTDSYTGQIETAADKTYFLDPFVSTNRTITKYFIQAGSGTVTATLKHGASGVTAASVSTTSGNQISLANTSVSSGASLCIVTSSNSSATDVRFSVEYTTTI